MANLEEDQKLLAQLSSDPNAFFILWQRYEKYLYRCCRKWMGSEMDAEDALSEVMFKAKKAMQAGPIRDLKAWLTRLSYNFCIDMLRQRTRQAQATIYLADLPEAGEEVMALTPLPFDVVVNQEFLREVQVVVKGLPPHLREPTRLYFFSAQSYDEIAAQLGIKQTLVRKRLQLARVMLQRELAPHLCDGPLPPSGKKTQPEREAEIKQSVISIYPVEVTLPTGNHIFHLPLRQKARRLKQKIASLQKHVERYPSGWKKCRQLADLFVATGRWEEAIATYRHVLSKQPRCLEVCLQLGHILHLYGCSAAAIAVYQEALPATCLESTLNHLRGLIATCQKQPDLASHHFELATLLEPDNAAHWNAYGLTHLPLQPALACQAFDQAIKLETNDLVALTHSCEALIALGCYQEAQLRATEARRLDPSNVLALKWLVDARVQSGLIWGPAGQESKHLIGEALRLVPHAPEVIDSLLRYHISRNEKQKALRVWRTFAKKHPSLATQIKSMSAIPGPQGTE